MEKFRFYINLYFAFVKNTLVRETDFRFNFLADLLDSLVSFLVSVIFFKAIYANVNTIKGWDVYETLLLVGTSQLITSVLFIFFMNNLPKIQHYILSGDLDYILLKPCDVQFYVSLRYFYFGGVANAIPSLMLISYCLKNIGIKFAVIKLAIFLFYVICGIVTAYSLWMISMTFSIYFLKVSELHELFLSTLKFMEYPASIYKGVIGFIFTFIIPFLAIANIPVEFLIGKINFSYSVCAFFIAVAFFFIARLFWKKSLNWYQSASC